MKMRAITLLFLTSTVFAYENETHGLMTLESFAISMLGPTNPASAELYLRLGFDRLAATPPFQQSGLPSCMDNGTSPSNEAYIDADPAWLNSAAPDASMRKFRCAKEYEQRSYPPTYRGLITSTLGATPTLRLEAWLIRVLPS
jgi:hypothetical protein